MKNRTGLMAHFAANFLAFGTIGFGSDNLNRCREYASLIPTRAMDLIWPEEETRRIRTNKQDAEGTLIRKN